MRKLLIALFLLSINGYSQSSKSVLFLGNSYTNYNNLPQLVVDIANSKGDTLTTDKNTPGGHTLQGHSSNTTSLSKIRQGGWDYVVLQDQSQIPSLSPAFVSSNSLPFARELGDSIYKYSPCGEPLFYMTWGRKNGDASNCNSYPPVCTYLGMQARLRSSYLIMGEESKAPVSPVGAVWRDFIANYPSVELYASDQSHPSLNGSYLAACTFYASIFHKSPVGAWRPNSMDSSLAYSIQSQVNTTVFDSSKVWGIYPVPPSQTTYNHIGGSGLQNDFAFYAIDSLHLDSVSWDFGNGNTANGFSVVNNYTSAGQFTIVSTHWKRCVSSIGTIDLLLFPQSTVENASTSFRIYPNPSSDRIRIESQMSGLIHFSIFSIDGRSLMDGRIENDEIDISYLSNGEYILMLEGGGKWYQHKFLKTE
jgi:hypothetical protein